MANTIDKTTDEALLRSIIDGSIEEFEDDTITTLPSANGQPTTGTFYQCTELKTISMPNLTTIPNEFCNGCSSLTKVNLPKAVSGNLSHSSGMFKNCTSLSVLHLPKFEVSNGGICDVDALSPMSNMASAPLTVVFPAIKQFQPSTNQYTFFRPDNLVNLDLGEDFEGMFGNKPLFYLGDNAKKTLKNMIFRSKSLPTLTSGFGINASSATALEAIYVPSSLIESYENGTNWSVMAGKYVALEGSKFEHYYADGTPIGLSSYGMIGYYAVGEQDDWDSETKTITSHVDNEFVVWNRPHMAARLSDGEIPTIFYNGYSSNYGGIQIYFGQPLSEISDTITIQYAYAESGSGFNFELTAGLKNDTSSSVGALWGYGYQSNVSGFASKEFHLITVELNSSGINKAYVDNTLVRENVSLNSCMSATAIGIGAHSGKGYLGPVAIYNRALTADEISEHYQFYVYNYMVGQTAFDSEGNFVGGYISGKPYEITWNQGYSIDSSGSVNSSESTQDYVSGPLQCHGVSAITVATTGNAWVANSVWFYDESGNPISVRSNIDMIPVPINAYYLRNYVHTSSSAGSPNSTIVPYVYDKLTDDSEYKLNTYYVLDYPTATTEPIKERSNPAYCYGATKLLTSLRSSSTIYFIDENKNDISNINCNRSDVSVEIDIPSGTHYISLYPNSGNPNPWIMFTA